jgi:hypothetical protein
MNQLRSPAFIKIKHTINSCLNTQQLSVAEIMIAAHLDIAESDLLRDIYNIKSQDFSPILEPK